MNPSKYNETYHNDWAWSLATKGATIPEIAEAFGVNKKTIERWSVEHPAFGESLNEGRELANSRIEKSLYKKALGYTVTETHRTIQVDKDGNAKPVKIETTDKHFAPDTGAIIYWLKNRNPKGWRDRPVDDKLVLEIDTSLASLSLEDLRKIAYGAFVVGEENAERNTAGED